MITLDQPLLSVREVSEALGLKDRDCRLIHKLIGTGKLAAVQVGARWKVLPDSLAKYVEENKNNESLARRRSR